MEIAKKIFKAYDIRGTYPDEINEKIVSEIIAAVVKNFKPKKIIVGHDARSSSPNLYRAAMKQITTNDPRPAIIVNAGLITTPMISFLTNYFKADLGIMITASHNPKKYNGLKIVGKKGKSGSLLPVSGKEIWKIIS